MCVRTSENGILAAFATKALKLRPQDVVLLWRSSPQPEGCRVAKCGGHMYLCVEGASLVAVEAMVEASCQLQHRCALWAAWAAPLWRYACIVVEAEVLVSG
jgi:hypothetical protein